MAAVLIPGGVVSMSTETADKLLALGQGDGALLYLALTRYGGQSVPAAAALGWSEGRLEAAYRALQTVDLVGAAPAKAPEPPPQYTTADITGALTGDNLFSKLCRQVEKLLGVPLSTVDLRILLEIYRDLALPYEVILTLVGWCISEMERKYGPGRRPKLSQVKKAAYRWRDKGIDTLPAAEEFLRAQRLLRGREAELLPRLGVRDRLPLEKEREYLATWVDWGFDDQTILLAYEKTLLKKQSMSWPYLNSILKNWHAKGLHTRKEVEAGEGAKPAPGGASAAAKPPSRRVAQDLADLRQAARKEG